MEKSLSLDRRTGPFGGNIELWEEMMTSKDRVTALIGASVLETRIESLLTSYIIHDSKIKKHIKNLLHPPDNIRERKDLKLQFCLTVHFLEHVILTRIHENKSIKYPKNYKWFYKENS